MITIVIVAVVKLTDNTDALPCAETVTLTKYEYLLNFLATLVSSRFSSPN